MADCGNLMEEFSNYSSVTTTNMMSPLLMWFRDGVNANVKLRRKFSAWSYTEFHFLMVKQDSQDYNKVISSILVPFFKSHHKNDFYFQQDTALIHISKETKANSRGKKGITENLLLKNSSSEGADFRNSNSRHSNAELCL